MTNKQLKKITQEEFESRINEHFYYVHGGDETKRADFTNIDFSNLTFPQQADLRGAIFDESDFSKIKIPDTNTGYQIGDKVYRAFCNGGDFRMASFRNVNFGDLTLSGSNFTDAILIGANFIPGNNFQGFLDGIIVHEKELQQGRALLITEKRETDSMLGIFDTLRWNYFKEEVLWIILAFFVFATIFMIFETVVASVNSSLAFIIFFLPYIGILFVVSLVIFTHGKKSDYKDYGWKDVGIGILLLIIFGTLLFGIKGSSISWTKLVCIGSIKNDSCISIEDTLKIMLPIISILFTFLWFSVHQYGKAKKLRIEQQNKQAMIHFMQAIIASDGKASRENQTFPMLAPFFANAIIHRPFSQENYEPQLPVDKIFQMAKDTKDIIK